MVKQGEIIEVNFRLPNDDCQRHPALVVSKVIHEVYGDFVYAILISTKNLNPQFTIEITPEMVTKPMSQQSFFVTHLLDKFELSYITRQNNNYIKPEYFDKVIIKIIHSIFGFDLEIDEG